VSGCRENRSSNIPGYAKKIASAVGALRPENREIDQLRRVEFEGPPSRHTASMLKAGRCRFAG